MTGIGNKDKDWRHADARHDIELWTFEYDNYPYLERVSDDELDQRYRDIVKNVGHLVCPLRDAVPARAQFISSWWWLKVKFHTEYEYSRRGRGLPPVDAVPPAPDRAVPYTPAYPNEGGFIVRYGEAKWLEPMLREGILRLRPASQYKGEVAQSDIARYDDELNSHRYISGSRVKIKSQSGQVIPIRGNLKHTTGLAGDYFVLCCSQEFDHRLFPAFRNSQGEVADACLVINNVDEFARRLDVVAQEKLNKWEFYWNPVMYFDPYNVLPNQKIIPGAFKDFKYAYQREYRFLWHPLSANPDLLFKAIDLEIGSLEDIATLHYYEG